MNSEFIICTCCGCVYGGKNWLNAVLDGWIWKRIKGIEHVLCPKDSQIVIEGE